MKYLFLDFDGVLHHTNIQSIQFENLPILAEVLKDYIEQFRIVISSSWREHHTYEFLIHIFPFSLRKIILSFLYLSSAYPSWIMSISLQFDQRAIFLTSLHLDVMPLLIISVHG